MQLFSSSCWLQYVQLCQVLNSFGLVFVCYSFPWHRQQPHQGSERHSDQPVCSDSGLLSKELCKSLISWSGTEKPNRLHISHNLEDLNSITTEASDNAFSDIDLAWCITLCTYIPVCYSADPPRVYEAATRLSELRAEERRTASRRWRLIGRPRVLEAAD